MNKDEKTVKISAADFEKLSTMAKKEHRTLKGQLAFLLEKAWKK